jgi:hypothetical protein
VFEAKKRFLRRGGPTLDRSIFRARIIGDFVDAPEQLISFNLPLNPLFFRSPYGWHDLSI